MAKIIRVLLVEPFEEPRLVTVEDIMVEWKVSKIVEDRG